MRWLSGRTDEKHAHSVFVKKANALVHKSRMGKTTVSTQTNAESSLVFTMSTLEQWFSQTGS